MNLIKEMLSTKFGPLDHMTTQGHQYILTVVDFATRFPKAAPPPKKKKKKLAQALWGIFSCVGCPQFS